MADESATRRIPAARLASHDRAEQAFERCQADLRDMARVDLPESRIHQFKGNPTFVADLAKLFDDRPQLKVAVAGENAIGVGCQFARDAGHVANLDKRQV